MALFPFYPFTWQSPMLIDLIADADAHVVWAALGGVVLVGAAGAHPEAVAGELDPGPGQGGHPSPGNVRRLGGISILLGKYTKKISAKSFLISS